MPAKRGAKYIMTIAAQDLVPLETGDPLRFKVEKKDLAVQIVGNDPFLEAVQDTGKIFLAGDIRSWAVLSHDFQLAPVVSGIGRKV